MTRSVSGMLAAALVCAVLFGGLLHSLIPHSHGHEHGGEASIWQSLHSGLRHEDKKAAPAFDAFAVVGFVALYAVVTLRSRESTHRHAFEYALRRGTLPHRKFG